MSFSPYLIRGHILNKETNVLVNDYRKIPSFSKYSEQSKIIVAFNILVYKRSLADKIWITVLTS